MVKKLLFTSIMAVMLFSFALAEDLTITTYYPSPNGSYKELRSQKMAIGPNFYASGTSGYCWGTGCSKIFSDSNDFVVERSAVIGAVKSQSSSALTLGTNSSTGATNYLALTDSTNSSNPSWIMNHRINSASVCPGCFDLTYLPSSAGAMETGKLLASPSGNISLGGATTNTAKLSVFNSDNQPYAIFARHTAASPAGSARYAITGQTWQNSGSNEAIGILGDGTTDAAGTIKYKTGVIGIAGANASQNFAGKFIGKVKIENSTVATPQVYDGSLTAQGPITAGDNIDNPVVIGPQVVVNETKNAISLGGVQRTTWPNTEVFQVTAQGFGFVGSVTWDVAVTASCPSDSVLTGCSSYYGAWCNNEWSCGIYGELPSGNNCLVGGRVKDGSLPVVATATCMRK